MLTLPTPGTAGWDADRVDGPQSSQLAWSPDGSSLIAGLKDATARVWDAKTGRQVLSLDPRVSSGMVGDAPVPEVWSVAISNDGSHMATASSDRTVRLWDAATGQLLRTLSGHTDRVVRAAFNADGTRLASASLDRTARIWDVATGQQLLISTRSLAHSPVSPSHLTAHGSRLRAKALKTPSMAGTPAPAVCSAPSVDHSVLPGASRSALTVAGL